jgi:hypothetical protein
MALDPTHRYEIEARGTVSDWCPPTATKASDCSGSPLQIGEGVDPLYCYAAWRCPSPQLWRQLQIDGEGLDQLAGTPGAITYNPGLFGSEAHRYVVTVTGVSGRLTLVAADAVGSSDNNSGAFTVVITDLGPASVGCG